MGYLLTIYHDGTKEEEVRLREAKLPVCQHTRHTKPQRIMFGDVTDANFAHIVQDF